ncbi:MAG: hypothetical protein RQ862_09430 [Candidatus Caldarchaeales archaeon]|nr:hypothetical protein [Candidatus Caldarchaeales archaeon]
MSIVIMGGVIKPLLPPRSRVGRPRADDRVVLNGGLAAMVYVAAAVSLGLVLYIDPLVLGILYGVVLWILTLYPIHEPITGISIHRHPLRHKPIILSILVHIVYGVAPTYVDSVGPHHPLGVAGVSKRPLQPSGLFSVRLER